MLFLRKKYLLNIKVYVIALIFVQFNKLTTQCSKRYGKSKGSYWLKRLEFGISRHVESLGKRRIHSTSSLFSRGRKEFSYTKFMRLVLKGTEFHKNLILLDHQLTVFSISRNLICLLSSVELLSLAWNFVKLRNKNLILKKDKELLQYQFELWSFQVTKRFKSGNFVFNDQNSSKFFYSNLVIFQSLSIVLVFVFERYMRCQYLGMETLAWSKTFVRIRENFGVSDWLVTGDLLFNHKTFMDILVKRTVDQAFIDVVAKFLHSSYFNLMLLHKLNFYECKQLIHIILSITFNSFDEWVEDSLVPRYKTSKICARLEKHTAGIVYIRHVSSVFMGFVGSREVSMELLNRVEEKFYSMSLNLQVSSTFVLRYKSALFLGYTITLDATSRVAVQVPVERVIFNLKELGCLSNKGVPTRNCKYLNNTLGEIVVNYRRIELYLLKQYYFSDNFSYLSKRVFYILRYSCALTICSKMKLKTLRKTFKQYGSCLSVVDGALLRSFRFASLKSDVKKLLVACKLY